MQNTDRIVADRRQTAATRRGGAAVSRGDEWIAAAADSVAGQVVGRVVVCAGTDLVDVDDIRALLARQPRFADRHFTPGERAYCLLERDPAERFAVRFAAKEAVLKALGTGLTGVALREIEVVRRHSGQPALALAGRAAALAAAAGVHSWMITLTHSRHLAYAFVAGVGQPS
ncbi:holo-ACP synthase [Micromonospora sp. NBC_00330]|uniref:holo-ACP synthase n=1 Tax=Micromonospora sp. NBC_00330 TaxID=2903585 RepID=UPI002E2B4B6C|nr:holo-ACP synthase [Micromonospora sp. NBC_00330]